MDNRTLEEVKKEEQRVRTKIEDLSTYLKHLQGVIAYSERQSGEARQIVLATISHEWGGPKLRGLTHKQAVVAIAKHNNGIVRSTEAKRLMIRYGIMKETKNSNRMVHNAIKNSKMFDAISPGEYRLKETSAILNKGDTEALSQLFTVTPKPVQ